MEIMMSTAVTKVMPEHVWRLVRNAYADCGKKKGCRYRLLSVDEGHSLSVEWRTWFSRLVVTHRVTPHPVGSEIMYQVAFCGIFGSCIRFFLRKRMQTMLDTVLKQFVQKLQFALDETGSL
jgi:hypothetical protein